MYLKIWSRRSLHRFCGRAQTYGNQSDVFDSPKPSYLTFETKKTSISRKDLNSAELETVTTSRSPMTVMTANGEVQTHEEATVYVKGLDIFLTMKVLEDTPAVFQSESFAMNTDTLVNGSMVKNHISLKTVFGHVGHSLIRKTSYQSWFLVCQRVLPPVFPLQHP